MTNNELKVAMSALYNAGDSKKILIAKAVSLGMQYQTEKIKDGIDIVFNELGNELVKKDK